MRCAWRCREVPELVNEIPHTVHRLDLGRRSEFGEVLQIIDEVGRAGGRSLRRYSVSGDYRSTAWPPLTGSVDLRAPAR